jgi:uncharacterized protein YggE
MIVVRNVLILLTGLCLVAGCNANEQVQQQREIRVSGQASVYSTPDLFTFSVYIEEQGELVSKLNAGVRAKSQSIIELLLKFGVDEKDLQSMRVDLNPWFEHVQSQRVQKGFVLSRQISVTLRNMEKYDQVIDGVLRLGASRIEGFNYVVKDPEQDYLKALELALTDAKGRADIIASSVGVKVGEVISVQEGSGYTPMPRMRESALMADSGGYLPGQVSTNAQVSVVYSLK